MFANGTISYKSKKQDFGAQSTGKAEFIAFAFSVMEALWLKEFSRPIHISIETFKNYIKKDNKGWISLTKHTVVNDLSEHIDIEYTLIIVNIRRGDIVVVYEITSEMVADALEKALSRDNF